MKLFLIFKQPNVGSKKDFVECDKAGLEVQITDATMATSFTTASTSAAASALDDGDLEEEKAEEEDEEEDETIESNVPD